MPRQTSVQLTEATERQAAALKAAGFGSMTDVIRIAIDRMYQQEKGQKTMTTKTTDYSDVFGNQATVEELVERFNESEYDTLEKYLESEAVAMHGSEADDNDYRAMARQIEGELYRKLLAEAEQAVESAAEEPATWFGRENAEQVVFANGVYTTACNGDGTDYTDPDKAADALASEWLRDQLKQR